MTHSVSNLHEAQTVIVGVDTHKHMHVAVAIDSRGIRLGAHSFGADSEGYRALLTWAEAYGGIEAVGIEGTGGYGVGLSESIVRGKSTARVIGSWKSNRVARRSASSRVGHDRRARHSVAAAGAARGASRDGAPALCGPCHPGNPRAGSPLAATIATPKIGPTAPVAMIARSEAHLAPR